MKNVYYVGSGELTFDLIERIINENLKLELLPKPKNAYRNAATIWIRKPPNPPNLSTGSPPASAPCAAKASRPTNWAPCRRTSSKAMLAAWARRSVPSSSN